MTMISSAQLGLSGGADKPVLKPTLLKGVLRTGGAVSKSFLDRADSAAFWEAWVGAVLARAGLYTMHYPFIADGDPSHGTTWDLDVSATNPYPSAAPVPIQTEVKSLNLSFGSVADYPYSEVLVCSQNSWIKKWPSRDYTMRDFLFVSRVTGDIVWLPTMSQVRMGKEVTDSTRGQTYKVVTTDKANLASLEDFVSYAKREKS